MIYYPNKIERYLCGFRQFYQNQILKNKIKPDYLNSLKKIYEFEAFTTAVLLPLNIEDYSSQLFTAVLLKKHFDYFISVQGNYLVNIKGFTALLLSVCKITDYVELCLINGKIAVKGNFLPNTNILKLANKVNANVYKLLNRNTTYIVLSYAKTQKKTVDYERAFYHLQNPLSAVNLYLGVQ